ncbi:MAG: sulfatase-like hydrolase/transferase [Chitinophagaceae bacterium]|nr:sulfatase-like hydrolase/transferase [Chitinophagaceae bacterium]
MKIPTQISPVTSKYGPVLIIASLAIFISFITRLSLLILTINDIDAGVLSIAGVFFIGLLYDIATTLFIILPLVLHISFTNNYIYTRKGRIITSVFFIVLLFILGFTSIVPKEFNKDLHKAVIGYVLLRFIIFLVLCVSTKNVRIKWRNAMLWIFIFITSFALLFNAVSEWFFWKEFSSRYNFIAVDYLVYTHETLGNIKESYPVAAIITCVALLSFFILFISRKKIWSSVVSPLNFKIRFLVAAICCTIILLPLYLVKPAWKNFSSNNYTNELAGNGIYEFVQAYQKNELDFVRYYKTIPDSTAFTIIRNELSSAYSSFTSNDLFDITRKINYPAPEKKMNVVLISVESLSASFLAAFGNKENITPNLDSLADKSLFFTNLYASGTRTVRGLEALSLSLPPTPGQSIVKRPGNEHLFSLGSVFKSKGYITQYIYGGYGYFDNMEYFFGNNDYSVKDRNALKASEIHYANIWGVADEDLFSMALRTMDSNYNQNKPFFSHVMTVSNHRPYTYPEGRIDIPPSKQIREGAVKYTDFAIGNFLKQARSKAWFNNTIFIVVADHCASSAGKEALPVTGYHIPMLIYSPQNIQPGKIDALTAQIDIAPTILGLLSFDYTTKFFGQDILNTPAEKQKAFISTYQGLGFIENNELVIQSPVKKINTYKPDFTTGEAKPIIGNDSTVLKAIAYYQTASWLIKNKKYGNLTTSAE